MKQLQSIEGPGAPAGLAGRISFLGLASSVLLLGASAISLTGPALASYSPPTPAAFQDEEDDSEDAEEGKKEEEEDDKFLALVGGEIHTGLGGVLRNATLLAKNGKIHSFGYDVDVPEGAEVVDLGGMRVYPGLIAVSSSGLFGGGGDLANSVDPYSQNMTLALAAGITTAVNGNTVAKLKRGHVKGLVVKEDAFESLSYSNGNPQGQLKVNENFQRASEYLREYRAYEEEKRSNKDAKEPSRKGVDDKSVSILRGEIRPRFAANSRTDLMEIAELAQRFGFRPIVEGAREGWTIADHLGRAGVTAIVTPRTRRGKDERQVAEGGSSIENAAKLYQHGVPVVVVPASNGISLGGIVGQDLLHLPIEAGFAIRGGLPEQAALESITLEAARVLGVDYRIGSIEVGKDADLIVTDGDLLHYQTFVQWAIVDGEIVYDKQEEMFFAHIRPRPESALAPEKTVDAGEEGAIDPEGEEEDGDGDDDDEDEDEDEDSEDK
ncbi:imidazolonepropionase [Planctomycetes bacterium Poly30]|uniref:Imidazolonepropionase n=1 Tax=Saltatorellus ferox TaxID=2528018 RepID=A0A518EYE9_9BACT|nr:imidazolonepropionase [Planctomycetes bacterium Poly30]